MNEEIRWKHGKPKEFEYGPWLRVGSPKRQSEPRKGGYSEDDFPQEEEGYHGAVPAMGAAGFRPARGTTMDSNGHQKRKETQGGKEGASLNRGNFSGNNSGGFPCGAFTTSMRDSPAVGKENNQGDSPVVGIKSVSVTSHFGDNMEDAGENYGGNEQMGEQWGQHGESAKEIDGNAGAIYGGQMCMGDQMRQPRESDKVYNAYAGETYGGHVFKEEQLRQLGEKNKEHNRKSGRENHQATSVHKHAGDCSFYSKETAGPHVQVECDFQSGQDDIGPTVRSGGSLRSWKKRAREKEEREIARHGNLPSLGKRHAETEVSVEKKKKASRKGEKEVGHVRSSEILVAAAGIQPRQEP